MSPLQVPGLDEPYTILDRSEVERIKALRRRYPDEKSAVLPALWLLQRREGLLTAQGMAEVARALEMPPGPVEAVASFYSMFFFRPHGAYVVEVCTNLSCFVCGAMRVLQSFEQKLAVAPGQTTPDGKVTLLEVECSGACSGAPVAQINHHFFENLTPDRVDGLVKQMKSGKLDVHKLKTGADASRRQAMVDLVNPGAYRAPLNAAGAAGPVVDLVKSPSLLSDQPHHPAERAHPESPSRRPSARSKRDDHHAGVV